VTDLKDYLREEIAEEGRLGYLSEQESSRRLQLLDDAANPEGGPAGQPSGQDYADDLVEASWTQIDGAAGPLTVYLARPANGGSVPGVVVVHENKGLVSYVQDVARRLAAAGFIALAPDLLTPAGGTRSFSDPAQATAALGKLAPQDMVAELKAAVDYLSDDGAGTNGRIGVIGFCFGGGMTWRLITQDQRLQGAVPFYGPNPPLEDVAAIQTPVFAIYGALDNRITSGLPAIETAMKDNGKAFEYTVYEGAQHAFHNDTNPDRYHPEAAQAAWTAAVEHLSAWLRG
jgi:carboxymethylenebutenolidase